MYIWTFYLYMSWKLYFFLFCLFVLKPKLELILFRSLPNGNCLFSSVSLPLAGVNSLMHEVTIMTAVELHLNATYYAQLPALKLFFKKSQSIMGCCELFIRSRYKNNLMETKVCQRYNVKRKVSKFIDSGFLICIILMVVILETANIELIDSQKFDQIFFWTKQIFFISNHWMHCPIFLGKNISWVLLFQMERWWLLP